MNKVLIALALLCVASAARAQEIEVFGNSSANRVSQATTRGTTGIETSIHEAKAELRALRTSIDDPIRVYATPTAIIFAGLNIGLAIRSRSAANCQAKPPSL